MRGVFVTATDTGVGKTALSAALAAGLLARGLSVAAHKPVLTGEAHPEPGVPADHALLAAITGQEPDEVTALRFDVPVSPHLAAALANVQIDPAALVATARAAGRGVDAVVVEGVGGLMVPLQDRYLVRDFARELGLPVVVAARPGLGTINHALLTLNVARAAGLEVRAVVMTPWPAAPSAMERSNAETIASVGEIDVAFLPRIEGHDPGAHATAAARLPIERWLGEATAIDDA